MNLLQLDQILKRLCIEIKNPADEMPKYEITKASNTVYAGIFFNGAYKDMHSVKVDENSLSHIYWSLVYQCMNEFYLSVSKSEEIFNQFNLKAA